MAFIFLVFTAAVAAIFFERRNVGMILIVAGIVLSFLMLWHHATDTLKINW